MSPTWPLSIVTNASTSATKLIAVESSNTCRSTTAFASRSANCARNGGPGTCSCWHNLFSPTQKSRPNQYSARAPLSPAPCVGGGRTGRQKRRSHRNSSDSRTHAVSAGSQASPGSKNWRLDENLKPLKNKLKKKLNRMV